MILDLARFEARTDERIPAAWTRSPPYDLTGLLALLGQTVTPSEPVTKKVIALGL